jgi:hypothetical protein
MVEVRMRERLGPAGVGLTAGHGETGTSVLDLGIDVGLSWAPPGIGWHELGRIHWWWLRVGADGAGSSDRQSHGYDERGAQSIHVPHLSSPGTSVGVDENETEPVREESSPAKAEISAGLGSRIGRILLIPGS